MDSESLFVLVLMTFSGTALFVWLTMLFEKENRDVGRVLFSIFFMLDGTWVFGAVIHDCIFRSIIQNSPIHVPIEQTMSSMGSVVCGLLFFAFTQVVYQVIKFWAKKQGKWAPQEFFVR